MASCYKPLSDGKRQIVRFAFPGDFLDLDGYLGTMDYSVATLGMCTVGVIPHQALRDLSRDNPDVANAFWRHTLADTAVFREWVVNVGQRSAQARIAHLICEVFSRLQEIGLATEIGGNRAFSWHVTQQDLADATGMSSVHVNRSLQQLRERGLIETSRDKVTILDWFGLKGLSGFKMDYLEIAQHGGSANRAGAQLHDVNRSPAHPG
jgi:CRP-like cAMP-binding protein